MEKYDDDIAINVGAGEDLEIRELAERIKDTVGFRGKIAWDNSKPNGTPRKFLDSSRIRSIGWSPSISLSVGISQTYAWYVSQSDQS